MCCFSWMKMDSDNLLHPGEYNDLKRKRKRIDKILISNHSQDIRRSSFMVWKLTHHFKCHDGHVHRVQYSVQLSYCFSYLPCVQKILPQRLHKNCLQFQPYSLSFPKKLPSIPCCFYPCCGKGRDRERDFYFWELIS